ncbi:MAG: serine hydrolase, partial [Chloroflexota bacterium]|nr:serine hydrolase [Chloroflexota bacterium]
MICLISTASVLSAASDPVKPSTLEELRAAIQRELDEVGHGSIGVALVSKDRAIWTAGIGMADPNTGREANANTYWRLGSITKSFVGLAALILQERGMLRLTDTVAELAPEIGIRNRWDTETPVRLAHLLDKDYASNDPTPLSLRQGIDHIRESLSCRWPPGLHLSYSNAGPAVAAYIVQELDGRPFEEFLKHEILEPLELAGAGMLLTDDLEARLAAGYNAEGIRVPYEHIVVRPSGALSATPRQMANFVRMLLNRGSFDGRQMVSPDSIARMERSETTLSGHLQPGYGLGNFPSSEHGFIFRGHNGGMPGYHARYAYLP